MFVVHLLVWTSCTVRTLEYIKCVSVALCVGYLGIGTAILSVKYSLC